MNIKGKVTKILPVQSGEGKNGEWKKRDFVIEFKDGEYQKALAFSIWKLDILDDVVEGSVVTVHFNLESKEYNNKWFTNANAWKIERHGGEDLSDTDENDLPF